jgi:ubiquinone/menaquinone biosynthesis C-methylase UbiE
MRFFNVPDTDQTLRFYSRLASGRAVPVGLFSLEKRFNVEKTLASPSVRRHYVGPLTEHLSPTMKVGDFGCGNGIFLPQLGKLCGEVIGVDATPALVEGAQKTLAKLETRNISVQRGNIEDLPFESGSFDSILLTDVIHHLQSPEKGLGEVWRVLKGSGKLLIFEPNILNPALLALSAVDRNEWGVLRLGRKSAYQKLLARYFEIESMEYNGLLIGPDVWLCRLIVHLINLPVLRTLFGWLSPKIFIVARPRPA